jgi:hypothetical protein
MGYWLTHRVYAHPEARTYNDPKTGEPKKVSTVAIAFAAYVLELMPTPIENTEAEGIEIEVTRGAFKRGLDIRTKETFRRALLAVTDSGILIANRYGDRDGYFFSVGPRLQCLKNGCENKHHYPGNSKKDRFGKRTRGEGQSPRGGGGSTTQEGGLDRPLLTSEELNNSKNLALAESEEVVQVTPMFVTTAQVDQRRQAEAESPEEMTRTIKRSFAQAGLDKGLAAERQGKDRPLNRCLKEYVLIRSIAGKDSLEQALEWSAQGLDLDPNGKNWKHASAQVESELIEVGGNE